MSDDNSSYSYTVGKITFLTVLVMISLSVTVLSLVLMYRSTVNISERISVVEKSVIRLSPL